MEILRAAILPIALVALAGVVVGRCFELEIKTLSRLNLYLLFPALVLTGLQDSSLGVSSAFGLVAGVGLTSVLLYGVAIATARFCGWTADEQKSLVATTLFSNTGNMGLPFVLFALGEAGLERAIVYMVASALMVAMVGPVALRGEGLAQGMRFSLRLPIVWATVAGVGLQLLVLQLPVALERSLVMMGEAAIPLALVTLGIQLARTRFTLGRAVLGAAGLRLGVSPLVAFGVGCLLRLSGLELQVLVVQAAMPVAVSSVIWVAELGGDAERVARAIVLSTVLSFGSLPVVLWLVQQAVG